MYRSFHRSRGMGWWLILLVIHAVIDGSYNMKLKPTMKHRQNFLKSFQYYNKSYNQLVKQHYNQSAGSVTENATKLSFAIKRMQAAECSQLCCRLLSSDNFNSQQGVAMLITVSVTAVPYAGR